MFEVREVLTRTRLGDTDRAIARAGLMGRRKLAQLRPRSCGRHRARRDPGRLAGARENDLARASGHRTISPCSTARRADRESRTAGLGVGTPGASAPPRMWVRSKGKGRHDDVDRTEARRQIDALKAIVQTMLPAVYPKDDGRSAQAFFNELLQDDEPVALAIADQLTEGESFGLSLGEGKRATASTRSSARCP